ncbi:MAG: hypothetical protein M3Z26_09960 [Bacteroidota bacterium]|nr:hypothetical protein [Bacteroidota bacterium]
MKQNILPGSMLIIGLAVFSMAAFGQQTVSHKINIIDFKVQKNHNRIDINWTTDNVTIVNYFEVEKSINGKDFKTIAYVLGPNPSKTNCDCYGFLDKISSGNSGSYYRLKHVNTNGELEFSETKIITFNK